MQLLHVSDTHLGFSEYHKIDSDSGLNQREKDFYDAWLQVVESILERKPDVVVHAGDLFHTPRPSNRAIHVALESIQRINDAAIPMVIVSGNHETPRIRSTGSIFESLSLFPNVYAAFSSRYERFRINDVDFHCVPHCSLTEDMEAAFQAVELQPKAARHVFVTHGAWSGKTYGMGEFNEQRLPDVEHITGASFDYIALGHYHRYIEIKPNVCYCGSTERTSLNEHQSDCGFLMVDLETMQKTYHPVKSRPMINFPAIDCSGLETASLYEKLQHLAREISPQSIVKLTLFNMENDTFLKLDKHSIDDIFAKAFVLEKQFSRQSSETHSTTHSRIESLPVEFERYLDAIPEAELEKTRLAKLGASYLADEN